MDAFQFGFFDELQKVAAGLMDAANFGNRPLPKPGTTPRPPSTLGTVSPADRRHVENLVRTALKSGNHRVIKVL